MKRIEILQGLSRDHRRGLILAQQSIELARKFSERFPDVTPDPNEPLHEDHARAQELLASVRGMEGADLPGLAVQIRTFFEAEVIPHFRKEEELLLPVFAVYRESEGLIAHTLTDHKQLRALAEAMKSGPDFSSERGRQIESFGRLLEEHVRFEERELFNVIQDTLSEQDKMMLGMLLKPLDNLPSHEL